MHFVSIYSKISVFDCEYCWLNSEGPLVYCPGSIPVLMYCDLILGIGSVTGSHPGEEAHALSWKSAHYAFQSIRELVSLNMEGGNICMLECLAEFKV